MWEHSEVVFVAVRAVAKFLAIAAATLAAVAGGTKIPAAVAATALSAAETPGSAFTAANTLAAVAAGTVVAAAPAAAALAFQRKLGSCGCNGGSSSFC